MLTAALDRVSTGSAHRLPCWVPLAELASRLDLLGFWELPHVRETTSESRLDLLGDLLELDTRAVDRKLQEARATEDIRDLLRDFIGEYRDALNEDLSRILLGEPVSH